VVLVVPGKQPLEIPEVLGLQGAEPELVQGEA